jgi:Fic family protein
MQHKTDYYRLLLNVTTNGDWLPWISYMLKAIDETARWTKAKVEAINALHEATREYVQIRHPKIYSYELVKQLFIQPYVRIGNLVDASVAKRQTASVYLQELCDSGVLQARQEGREKLFMNVRFMELLQSDGNTFRSFIQT